MIDSLNGYYHAMPNEQYLMLQLHDLLGYLSHRGVVTLLVLGQHGLTGAVHSQVDLSSSLRHPHPHALLRGGGRGAQGPVRGKDPHRAA